VDFCTFPWGTASIELWPIMDFTSLVMQEPFNIIAPWPKEESRLTAVIRPFNLVVHIGSCNSHFFFLKNPNTLYYPMNQTWIMIFFSSFALVVFVALLPLIYGPWNNQESDVTRRNNSRLQLVGKAVMYVVAIFTQHGD